MTDFCRITGHARNLPKPCYFPLLPPITPADAKKLCRITGKSNVVHSFSPIIAFGKPIRFDGVVGCKITKYEDSNYTRPLFEKTKDNEMTYHDLDSVLKKMRNKDKMESEYHKMYVYQVTDQRISLVLPPEMEEAIRTGELESVSMSKDGKYINVKVNQGRIVKLKCKGMSYADVQERDDLYYGLGQNKDILEKQQRILNERNKRKSNTMARKMRFEGLEAKAEEEYLRDTVKPPFKKPRVKFNAKQRAEKLSKMEALMKEQSQNKAIVLPKLDIKKAKDEELQYERMLSDITTAQVTSINITIVSSGFDWAAAEAAESAGFDWDSFPHEEWIDPIEVEETAVRVEEVLVREDVTKLDIVASVETVMPAVAMPEEVAKAVIDMVDRSVLKQTENVSVTLKVIKEIEMIPTFEDICKIASAIETAETGYMVQKDEGTEFVPKASYVESEAKAVAGAMVEVSDTKKFVVGQVIKLADQESFIAGQTVETGEGKKFVPGQVIMNRQGDVNFVPGQCVKSLNEEINFVSGQIFHTPDGPKFVSGQVMDVGDGKSSFVVGQTISTEAGPKFTPGEVATDIYGDEVFVPGMKLPTAQGDKFVAGQAFQTEQGLTFKPGQILDTVEGPTFVPGKTFDTPEGKKFIKGDLVQAEDGKLKFEHTPFEVPRISEWLVIPNKELVPLAFADRNVAGFIVNPTNTDGVLVGEKLHGDMVETQDTVQFYIAGKLPKDLPAEAKVIPGQLIVNLEDKRFIPGKLMQTADGEKFVPGQLVNTTHGEEFIPGQVVESSEGPKFVPGQLVMTAQGEKFVPGQVIVEDEGPKFVPGQIIQTNNGATFIPGQMMNTDDGQLFVPGQLVETNDGPRFVPGQVVESEDGPKFIPGTIIETDEGLKYVPPDADEYDEEFEFSFQGYEISPEELRLLMVNPADARPHSPIVNEECLIDSATLKKLAAESVVVHGVTPEPPPQEKKKKRKRPKVQIDGEEEKMEADEPDDGTEKLELLQKLIRASSCINQARKEKEMRKLSNILGDFEHETIPSVQIDAMLRILTLSDSAKDAFRAFFGDDEETLNIIVENIGNIESLTRNDEAKKALRNAIQEVITSKCDKEIEDIIHLLDVNPDNLLTDQKTQVLLTEAVGIVCVTGNVEVAAMLEKFISEPSDPNTLRDNTDVVKVLRQLLVLHQIADSDPETARILQVLQSNPEGLKDRRKVRELLRSANQLLCKPDATVKKFDIRHVASSKDIPKEIFQQIKEDKKEADKFIEMLPDELFQAIMGDKRCGQYLMGSLDSEKTKKAKSELEKFKQGMAIVVTKESMQAVIPKEYSRSVCYGIIPYILIDEEGFKFFERGLTGRKLAPARVIENTWYMPDAYYMKKPSFARTLSGEKYSMTMLGRRRASTTRELLYTSLLPSAGPTRLSYDIQSNGDLGEMVPYHASNAGNIIWTDLDGAPLTVHRKSSHLGYDFGDLDLPSMQRRNTRADFSDDEIPPPRRRSLATNEFGDYDMGNFIYRRTSKEERDDFGNNYRAIIPLQPVIVDEEEYGPPVSSLCRSDTVANLLTKYSNFSLNREFGYHAPQSAYNRHIGKTRDFLATIPDIREDVPSPVNDPNRALVPVSNVQDDIGQARISHSRDRSRSHTPRDVSMFPRESLDEPYREMSRGRESSYATRDNVRSREESYVSSAHKRLSDIHEDERESVRPASITKEEKRLSPPLVDVPDYLMQTPEQMGPRGRPGGALQRYRERKAREAQGIFEHPDYSSYYLEEDGENEAPQSLPKRPEPRAPSVHQDRHEEDRMSRTNSRQSQSNDMSHRECPDPYHKRMRELQDRAEPESYSRASQDPYGRDSYDPYGPSSRAPYRRQPQDPYGQPPPASYGYGMDDPQSRMPPDPYARRSQDPYSRGMQDPYGRPPPNPYQRYSDQREDYWDKPFKLRFDRQRVTEEPEGQEYGGSHSRSSRNYNSRVTDDYGSGYSSGYGNNSYGNNSAAYGEYNDTMNNGSESVRSRIERTASKFLPYIDDDDRAVRSFTPREEERRAIGKLASKYLKPRATRDLVLDDDE